MKERLVVMCYEITSVVETKYRNGRRYIKRKNRYDGSLTYWGEAFRPDREGHLRLRLIRISKDCYYNNWL